MDTERRPTPEPISGLRNTEITRRAAQAFPVGDFIAEEAETRGWTNEELALALDWSFADLQQVLYAKGRLSEYMATRLQHVFGVPAQYWLNLQASYWEWRAANA